MKFELIQTPHSHIHNPEKSEATIAELCLVHDMNFIKSVFASFNSSRFFLSACDSFAGENEDAADFHTSW